MLRTRLRLAADRRTLFLARKEGRKRRSWPSSRSSRRGGRCRGMPGGGSAQVGSPAVACLARDVVGRSFRVPRFLLVVPSSPEPRVGRGGVRGAKRLLSSRPTVCWSRSGWVVWWVGDSPPVFGFCRASGLLAGMRLVPARRWGSSLVGERSSGRCFGRASVRARSSSRSRVSGCGWSLRLFAPGARRCHLPKGSCSAGVWRGVCGLSLCRHASIGVVRRRSYRGCRRGGARPSPRRALRVCSDPGHLPGEALGSAGARFPVRGFPPDEASFRACWSHSPVEGPAWPCSPAWNPGIIGREYGADVLCRVQRALSSRAAVGDNQRSVSSPGSSPKARIRAGQRSAARPRNNRPILRTRLRLAADRYTLFLCRNEGQAWNRGGRCSCG